MSDKAPNVSTAILHACSINGDGSGAALEGKAISKVVQADALGWVHLDGAHEDARGWLEFDGGALMILRGVNLNEDAAVEDMISLRIWIDAHRIITVQRRPLRAVADIHSRLMDGRGVKDSGEFIAALAGRLFERMEPAFADLDEALDDIEEKIMEEPDPAERQAVVAIRKKTIIFRRYIAPQRDVISYLRTSEAKWLRAHHRRSLQEVLDRIVRYIEDLDTIRERAQIVKDELANGLADRMNKNMYVLSVIAAIFLPLGFLTGLLGINVGGIPGANYGGSFIIFCVMLIAVVAAQVYIFRKLKWF